MFILGAMIWFGNCFHTLTIPSEVQAVQNIIHLLMNHVLTSDYLLGSVCVFKPAE